MPCSKTVDFVVVLRVGDFGSQDSGGMCVEVWEIRALGSRKRVLMKAQQIAIHRIAHRGVLDSAYCKTCPHPGVLEAKCPPK